MTLEVQLSHRFPGFALDLAFQAPPGITALFGRSGAGKSTVVNAVAGLLCPEQGRIALDGRVLTDTQTRQFLPPHKRRIGYVFQDARLFPHLTVRQNLLYGRFFAPKGGASLDRITELLGIGPLLSRRPGALSGGERSRVALGRAILSNPALLLMDEPLAALDGARKAEILPYLERLRDETRVPILYVSHSVAEVARLATTVVLMEGGRVTAAGPAGQVFADPDAASGLGEAGAILTGRLAAQEADGLSRIDTPAGPVFLTGVAAPVGTELRLRILARDVMLALDPPQRISALNVLTGTVTELRQDGSQALVRLDCGGVPVLARITPRSARVLDLGPGRPVHAVLKAVTLAQQDIGRL